MVYLNICLTLFHKPFLFMILVCWKILQHFTIELMLSSTLFFPSIILEWNKLERKTQQCSTMLTFRNSLWKIGWPGPKPVYNIHNPNGLKLLTRLRLGFSHLNGCKFNHNFKGCVNPLCSCIVDVKFVPHFFRHCYYFTNIQKNLFHELQSVSKIILNQSGNEIVELLCEVVSLKSNRTVVYWDLSNPL